MKTGIVSISRRYLHYPETTAIRGLLKVHLKVRLKVRWESGCDAEPLGRGVRLRCRGAGGAGWGFKRRRSWSTSRTGL
ncbi:hypothetical protein BDZ91DRAFT_723399 [Kalaharituber pfeilii]|nr:hypothetical protein BDZ91DRAFT_723399 [Kalaharituber pfeilii]